MHIITSNAYESIEAECEEPFSRLNDAFKVIFLSIKEDSTSKIIRTSVTEENNHTIIKVSYPIGKNFFSKNRTYLNSVTSGLSELIKLNIKIDAVYLEKITKNLSIANKYFDYLPIILNDNTTFFTNGSFSRLNNWKQKKTLKRLNNCAYIYTSNIEIKKSISDLGISTPIKLIEEKDINNLLLKDYKIHTAQK